MYKNLEAAIAASGIKKQVIAEKLGITHACLNNKLSGKTKFYVEEAFALMVILHLDADQVSFYFNSSV